MLLLAQTSGSFCLLCMHPASRLYAPKHILYTQQTKPDQPGSRAFGNSTCLEAAATLPSHPVLLDTTHWPVHCLCSALRSPTAIHSLVLSGGTVGLLSTFTTLYCSMCFAMCLQLVSPFGMLNLAYQLRSKTAVRARSLFVTCFHSLESCTTLLHSGVQDLAQQKMPASCMDKTTLLSALVVPVHYPVHQECSGLLHFKAHLAATSSILTLRPPGVLHHLLSCGWGHAVQHAGQRLAQVDVEGANPVPQRNALDPQVAQQQRVAQRLLQAGVVLLGTHKAT